MKIAIYILFASVNLILMLNVPEAAKLKYLKIYGLAIPVTFIVAVLVIFLMKLSGQVPGETVKYYFFGLLLSVLVILLINFIIILADYMLDRMIRFHTENNQDNVSRFPVRFAIENSESIKLCIKIIFYSGSLIMLYGIWFGKNNTIGFQ